MHSYLFYLLIFICALTNSQTIISGNIIDNETNNPLPFATISSAEGTNTVSGIDGTFTLTVSSFPQKIAIQYIGYQKKKINLTEPPRAIIKIRLSPKKEILDSVALEIKGNTAKNLIKKTIAAKKDNDPKKVLAKFSYKTYQKFKITEENSADLLTPDTTTVALEQIFNKAHSFISEKVSSYQFETGKDEKETVLASRMSGFKKPIYKILGIKIQSNSLYGSKYVIFDNEYAGPLSKSALSNYYYKILDTTATKRQAYVVLFQPRKSKKIASIEGLLYLDMETLAIQKAIVEVKGELDIKAVHNYNYLPDKKIWFPDNQKINITPGNGKQKISLFGGRIAVGTLANKTVANANADLLEATSDFFDITLDSASAIIPNQPKIQIEPDAGNRDETYWKQFRTQIITEKDSVSFRVVDSIVKAQRIERRINVKQSFNIGYYPVGFYNVDLTYPLKYNNYEGLRFGIGGVTNSKFSNMFRIENYLVYGFRDAKFKFGLGLGFLLRKKSGTWLNVNYTDDLRELGSLFYLTDRRVYSLFEPRLVNIISYYHHSTWSSSLQHRILPKLLSETQVSFSDIDQTERYRFLNNGEILSSYQMAEATVALRWSPFSTFLNAPDGFKEIKDGYPKVTAQYTKGFKGVLESDFEYSKFGLQASYSIQRLNLSRTDFSLEGSIANGDIPLTHLFHAYPNAPTKETILQRFSVAGRRSFETMFFNEFFSDRLITLQAKHQLRPFTFSDKFKPELAFITRHAWGDIQNVENHLNFDVTSLKQGYHEAGLEINKLFAGFGLSFAYRYGAYHLPEIGDNIALKFTFYAKL